MPRNRLKILDTLIDASSWNDALGNITDWSSRHQSRTVCLCNVHSAVTATRDMQFRQAINSADLAAPDGAPIAWALRRLGMKSQERISGPDLMWRVMEASERIGHSIFLYGSTDATLATLSIAIRAQFPALRIAGTCSPPFRPQSDLEDLADIAMINQSGANLVFVGLGCPKQEKWMAAHHGRIQAVMIGVGAAFDFHSGAVARAPVWMQRYGLEWLHRLFSDPRRLLKRYLITNTLFIIGITRQLMDRKRS